jgi:hypothetical protein
MFDWTHLIPKFEVIFEGGLNSTDGVSAVVVGLLMLTFVAFLAWSFVKRWQGSKNVRFFSALVDGLKQPELPGLRNELRERAAQGGQYKGRLWREFDESLVYSTDKKRLSNTLDAAHFFNTHTLAQGLTENRLIAAVPGFLTAIGVIGTFLGLYIGLSGIDLETDDVNLIKSSIQGMVGGASTAFLTSVWGVFLSVSFNFIEKTLERSVRKGISDLQNEIDFLYPRINAEQSLVEIADHGQNSAETLQGLAEKIGDKMQEALVEVTDSINTGLKDSLHEVMAPALERMASDAQQGSEKVLENLLGGFTEKMGAAGEQQKAMMDAASGEVSKAVGELGLQMSSFITQLDERAEAVDQKNQLQNEQMQAVVDGFEGQIERQSTAMANKFDDMLSGMVNGIDEQLQTQQQESAQRNQVMTEQMEQFSFKQQAAIEQMSQAVQVQLDDQRRRETEQAQAVEDKLANFTSKQNSVVAQMGQAVEEQLQAQRELDSERAKESSKLLDDLAQTQADLYSRVQQLIELQRQVNEQITSQLRTAGDSLGQVAQTNNQAAKETVSATNNMTTVSSQLSLLGSKLSDAVEGLGEMVEDASTTTDQVTLRNKETMDQLDSILSQYQAFNGEMEKVASKLDSATQSAEQGFKAADQHLQSFKTSMEQQRQDFAEKVSELLTDYSQKVSNQTGERLNEWNKQTNEYVSTMSQAITTLSGVVDEIETKVAVTS